MKKLISILLVALMLHTAAFAAPQIVFDNAKRTIDISGVSEHKNTMLSVMVMKDGIDTSNFAQAELLYKLLTDKDGKYSGQFLLPTEEEDTVGGYYYNVYVSGDSESGKIYIATPTEISNCITAFTAPTADTIADAIENNKKVLGVPLDGIHKKYTAWVQKAMLEFISEQSPSTLTEIIKYFNMVDLGSLIAPRRFVMVNGIEDSIFPIKGAEESFEVIKKAYKKVGKEDLCHMVKGKGGHQFFPDVTWPIVKSIL